MTSRRFAAPWGVKQIPGGFKVLDASGQALVYVYAREPREQADIAKVLTFYEARRIAAGTSDRPPIIRSSIRVPFVQASFLGRRHGEWAPTLAAVNPIPAHAKSQPHARLIFFNTIRPVMAKIHPASITIGVNHSSL